MDTVIVVAKALGSLMGLVVCLVGTRYPPRGIAHDADGSLPLKHGFIALGLEAGGLAIIVLSWLFVPVAVIFGTCLLVLIVWVNSRRTVSPSTK